MDEHHGRAIAYVDLLDALLVSRFRDLGSIAPWPA